MSAQLKHRLLTVEEYLAFEECCEVKHEYIDGEIYALAGASSRHNRITLNLASRLIFAPVPV
jgi:Uma2 family endonuclease